MQCQNNSLYIIKALETKLVFYQFLDDEEQRRIQMEISDYLTWIIAYFTDFDNSQDYFIDFQLFQNIMKFANKNYRSDITRMIYQELKESYKKNPANIYSKLKIDFFYYKSITNPIEGLNHLD